MTDVKGTLKKLWKNKHILKVHCNDFFTGSIPFHILIAKESGRKRI